MSSFFLIYLMLKLRAAEILSSFHYLKLKFKTGGIHSFLIFFQWISGPFRVFILCCPAEDGGYHPEITVSHRLGRCRIWTQNLRTSLRCTHWAITSPNFSFIIWCSNLMLSRSLLFFKFNGIETWGCWDPFFSSLSADETWNCWDFFFLSQLKFFLSFEFDVETWGCWHSTFTVWNKNLRQLFEMNTTQCSVWSRWLEEDRISFYLLRWNCIHKAPCISFFLQLASWASWNPF